MARKVQQRILAYLFQMMRDFHLIFFVLVLVFIDIVFITAWIFYDSLKPEEVIFDDLVRLLYLSLY